MDIKEEIKNSIRLSEVIGKNISLKRRDKSNYIALCPFHKEKTPSFNVSDDKGFFHCFGCGKNGDIFTYLMEMENVTFVDALKKLADQAGINYNYDTFSENPKLKNQLHLLKRVSDSYVQNLNAPIGEKVRNYLYERGINKSIIQNFRIGYSGNLKSNDYLVLRLKEEGFSISDMIEIGLVKENQNKKHTFYFQQRLMIPILNNSGKVIAFGGRLIGEGNPKYLNSPETFLFHKSKQLFGVMNAKKYLNNKRLVVCEGYMDVISLTSHGYPAVASLGTALTENQIENIFNISDEAFLVFDGDNAGQNATLRVFEKYLPKLKLNKKLKFVFLPDRLDPEEFINKNGLNEFEKILDGAMGALDMIWMQGLKKIKENDPESHALFWNYLRSKVNLIENINIKQAFRDEIEMADTPYQSSSDLILIKSKDVVPTINGDRFEYLPYRINKENTKVGYLIKIYEGTKYIAYINKSKKFMEAKIARTSLENSFPPRYVDDSKIYISISGNTAIEIKNSKKSVLKLFGNQVNLKKFIKSEKIRFDSTESLIRVLKFLEN